MSSTTPHIIVLATAWGPKHGGINAFNVEWIKSLGITPRRNFDLTCLVLQASEADHADARASHVTLVALGIDGKEMGVNLTEQSQTALNAHLRPGTGTQVIWVGHDDKTGPLALALRDGLPGSKAVLFNHMAFGAYQAFKKNDPTEAAEKKKFQRDLFSRADLCFAVGPMLAGHLCDLLSTVINAPPIEMFVPGLTELDALGLQATPKAPNNFSAFVAGRLHREDDRIKQGRLAVEALGKAMADAPDGSVLSKSPELRMRGVREEERQEIQTLFVKSARRQIAFDLSDYTEDRTAYFTDLASSSLAMMPSWHEGFGLVAWEALACGVPVVLGQQSGVYRLLDDGNLNMRRVVGEVNVGGHKPSHEEEAPYTPQDVAATAQAIHSLTADPQRSKQAALDLRHDLRGRGYVWPTQVKAWLLAVQQHFGYQLEANTPVPAPREATAPVTPAGLHWLRQPTPTRGHTPSSWLLAADQVVRFDPQREPDVQRLLLWAQPERTALSVLRLTGAGGMGKTRLAIELSQRLATADPPWQVMWLARELPQDWPSQWLEAWAAQPRPGLLVIDYTEGRIEAWLRALTALRQKPAHAPALRILLLCRSGAWWNDQCTHPEFNTDCAAVLDTLEDNGEHSLALWPDNNLPARQTSFVQALHDFANAQQQTAPSHYTEPDWANAAFGRPLYLHLAALAALAGERIASASTLLTQQLEREWRYWLQAVRIAYPKLAQRPHHSLWQAAMAWLVWTQGTTASACQAALAALNLTNSADELSSFIKALATVYVDGNNDPVIPPLQPDLLGEALLENSLTSPVGAALLRAALHTHAAPCAEVLARLCSHSKGHITQSPWRDALSQYLTQSWPVMGSDAHALVAAAHRGEFGLGELLADVWESLSPDGQTHLANTLVLPEYSVNLIGLWTRVARTRLQLASSDEDKAAALVTLSVCLSKQGDAQSRQEALVFAREGVNIDRQLAQQQPAAYLPGLSRSLNNLAIRLSEQGDAQSRQEALAFARKAVAIYRQLAQQQPATYLPGLSRSLNNLALFLSEQGDAQSQQEALAFAREAVQIGRLLAQQQPAAYLPDLAGSLNNLAMCLSEQGDAQSRQDTLTFAREAVTIYRQLTQQQPAAHLPKLAGSLNNLANGLSEQGDAHSRQEALAFAREAVQIRRQLAQQQPAAYLPDLAMSLNNLANRLSEQGDARSRQEALACAREAVNIGRPLTQQQPAVYLPDLAMSLNNLASFLSEQGDAQSRQEALAVAREAMTTYRQLAQQQPAVYWPKLAASQNNLANRLSEQGDAQSRQEALVFAREAATIYRQLAQQQPAAYLPGLSMSQNNLAHRLSEQGDARSRQEALACAREAVSIYRQLAQQQPAAYLSQLAGSLNNLAMFLSEQGDAPSRQEALACAREAVRIYAVRYQQMPAAFERNLGIALRVYLACATQLGLDRNEALRQLDSDEEP